MVSTVFGKSPQDSRNADLIFFSDVCLPLFFWILGHTSNAQDLLLARDQRSLLVVIGGSYAVLGIKSGLTAYKANVLTSLLSHWPLICIVGRGQ